MKPKNPTASFKTSAKKSAKATKGTDSWVEKLSKTEMPILSTVLKQMNRLTGDDDTEVNQLAEVILKDPHLTSQILKIANSVQYKPSSTTSINTISRAIVLLGFRGVRSLCISLMVVDSLLGKEPRERLLQTMATAFHAAVQAKSIYEKINDKGHEEVFIAALLQNLGEMAFWAYGGQAADKLDHTLKESIQAGQAVIEKELGTSFKLLSRELGKVWNLGETLQESLSSEKKVSVKSQAVRLGDAISQLGPEDQAGRAALVKQVASLTGQAMVDARKMINEASETATAVAVDYGASQVCHLMPRQQDIQRVEHQQATHVLEADPNLQLKILRDLSNAVAENIDVNTVFQMTLEGMHRGIGLERVVLAFVRQDYIRAKYVLGQFTEGWREQFNFDITPNAKNIFADCVNKPQPLWLDQKYLDSHDDDYNEHILSLMGKRPAYIAVLKINNRNAALFYADRGLTKEALSQDQFDSFRHFFTQAELSIQAMASKKTSG